MPARASSAVASPSPKPGCEARNALDDALVLLGQHAAGRVDDAAAELHERGGGARIAACFARELGDVDRLVAAT